MRIQFNDTMALLIVDVQNDLCPGGALAVKEGNKIIPAINRYIEISRKNNIRIFASRHWHSPRSRQFKNNGGPWPAHCVEGTPGGGFHPALKLPAETSIISKTLLPEDNTYSVLGRLDGNSHSFKNVLNRCGIRTLLICGLTTDYGVKDTVIDARHNGFTVLLLVDAIQGLDFQEGDSRRALREMLLKGARYKRLSSFEAK